MGWTTFRRDPAVSVKDTLARELQDDKHRIIDAAIVNRTEYYAAVEYLVDTPHYAKGTVRALVCLLRYMPREDFNFGYKDMDESMQPYYFKCPARILDKLTPTDDAGSNAWRAACRTVQAKPRPKAGQLVRFAAPITFRNNASGDTFRYVKGSLFTADMPYPGARYRITAWKDREFTVLEG